MQSTGPMGEILVALSAQDAELDGMLNGLDEDGWALPSRCDGWSIADVVLHVCQTNEAAVASAQGRTAGVTAFFRDARAGGGNVDDMAAAAVAAERGASGKEVHERWRASSAAQVAALDACDPGARLPWAVGDLSAVTLATTRLAEVWIHTGDVAAALGRPQQSGPHLKPIARLAWRTLPYAFARSGRSLSGPVAVTLDTPDGPTWEFTPDEPAVTSVTGPALDFCLVAARRADPSDTALRASGPDAAAVLELVRTFA